MLCVLILYMKNDRLYKKLVMAILFNTRVFASTSPGVSRQRNIFLYVVSLRCVTWGLNRALNSYKRTHYLIDYGNLYNLVNYHEGMPFEKASDDSIIERHSYHTKTFSCETNMSSAIAYIHT